MNRHVTMPCWPLFFLAVLAMLPIAAAHAAELPVNKWVVVEDEEDGGTLAGIVYLPEERGMFLWGIRARKDWRGRTLSTRYWTELFDTAKREWRELVPEAGRVEAFLGRHSYYTEWVEREGEPIPALPGHNRGFWHANQLCYLPEEKKVFYYLGGSTFTYDPAERRFENLDVALADAPPDVMLGTMAWDPVNKEVVLFGGGYLRAYQAKPGDVRQERPEGAWTPDRWDRRGTWTYSPRQNRWRKVQTASENVLSANREVGDLRRRLRDLWGAVRAVAFEYSDKMHGKPAGELADTCREIAERTQKLTGRLVDWQASGSDYQRLQFALASGSLGIGALRELQAAADALDAADGWRAFRALERASEQAMHTQELLAVAPRPRHYARMVYDPKAQAIVLWGGDGEDRYFADTWLYQCKTRRWERPWGAGAVLGNHPPPSGHGMVAMDYDPKHGVIVLAQQDGSVWIFGTGIDRWARIDVDARDFGREGYPPTSWIAMEYDPVEDVHVLVDMVGQSRKTLLLRLDPDRADVLEMPGGDDALVEGWTPADVWRDDKYQRAWEHLPKTQEEYRGLVEEHKQRIAAVEPNTWTEFPAEYSGWGRAYGSFCYDWERDQIVLWGGGHSAYMGNEVSQYDLKSNLWMESWNPEFPPHPYGCPDGPGWHPSFYHEKGTHHGYHHYVYCSDLGKISFFGGSLLYDPDRMRYSPEQIEKVGPGGRGLAVEMNGAAGLFNVSARYYRGSPFGVWRADFEAMTLSRIEGSDTPAETNDRAKIVYDTRRDRVLWYGMKDPETGKCNALFAYELNANRWERIDCRVEPSGANAPEIKAWNYCYSPKHDCLLIAPEDGTWVYDCKTNVLKKLNDQGHGDQPGVIYATAHDLFYTLRGGGYKPQQVFVIRYVP